jgi:hypothetical protein
MSRIIAYMNIDALNGRRAGSFKDGQYIRFITCDQDCIFHFWDQERNHLYQEEALKGSGYFPQSIDTETSSFSGTVVLILGGFFPDNPNKATTITIATDYRISPPIWYGGDHLSMTEAQEAALLGSDEHSHSLTLEELRARYDGKEGPIEHHEEWPDEYADLEIPEEEE